MFFDILARKNRAKESSHAATMVAVTVAKGLEARKTVLTYIIIIVQAAVRNTTPFLTGHEWHAEGDPQRP